MFRRVAGGYKSLEPVSTFEPGKHPYCELSEDAYEWLVLNTRATRDEQGS